LIDYYLLDKDDKVIAGTAGEFHFWHDSLDERGKTQMGFTVDYTVLEGKDISTVFMHMDLSFGIHGEPQNYILDIVL